MSLARERGWLLTWDRNQWIYLLNQAGQVQAQVRFHGHIAQCALADDGTAAVAVGRGGEVRWLAPDLTTRWERNLKNPLVATAVDPFGHFVAVADRRGSVQTLDHLGKTIAEVPCRRALQHLAFIPTLPLIVGCADFGLIGALGTEGNWAWQETLVVNVGGLSVNGDGSALLLACFSEGLHHFNKDGKGQPRIGTPEPCRLVAQSFAGDRLLIAGMNDHIFCLDRSGQVMAHHSFKEPLNALAFGPRGEAAYGALGSGAVVKVELKRL